MTKQQIINWLQSNWFKIIAAGVLVGALGNHPYAYYQMTRWVVMAAALYAAYRYYEGDRKITSVVMLGVGILFNPIAPFYLSKNTWQEFDAIAAVLFVATLFWRERSRPELV